MTSHAQIRAKERLGLDLTGRELWAITQFILGGQAELVSDDGECSLWGVSLKGRDCVVVLHTATSRIKTILTPEMVVR